jgi:hypothetical protein
VVDGSACPAADRTSSRLAPLSSAVVINVARIEWAEYPLLSPIDRAILAQDAVNHLRMQRPALLKAFAVVTHRPEQRSFDISAVRDTICLVPHGDRALSDLSMVPPTRSPSWLDRSTRGHCTHHGMKVAQTSVCSVLPGLV